MIADMEMADEWHRAAAKIYHCREEVIAPLSMMSADTLLRAEISCNMHFARRARKVIGFAPARLCLPPTRRPQDAYGHRRSPIRRQVARHFPHFQRRARDMAARPTGALLAPMAAARCRLANSHRDGRHALHAYHYLSRFAKMNKIRDALRGSALSPPFKES